MPRDHRRGGLPRSTPASLRRASRRSLKPHRPRPAAVRTRRLGWFQWHTSPRSDTSRQAARDRRRTCPDGREDAPASSEVAASTTNTGTATGRLSVATTPAASLGFAATEAPRSCRLIVPVASEAAWRAPRSLSGALRYLSSRTQTARERVTILSLETAALKWSSDRSRAFPIARTRSSATRSVRDRDPRDCEGEKEDAASAASKCGGQGAWRSVSAATGTSFRRHVLPVNNPAGRSCRQ